MALVLTRNRYFLVKIGVICKNGGVGIGLASWEEGYVALAFGRMRRVGESIAFVAALVCAALRFVCCLKGALHEFGRCSAY